VSIEAPYHSTSIAYDISRPIPDPILDGFCSDKKDGNYPHPYSCTHYIACVAQTEAYDMICAQNHDGCPLHYVPWSGPNPVTSHCDYPEVAGCQVECPEEYPSIGNEVDNMVVSDADRNGKVAVEDCDPDTLCSADGEL
jgi:hypothetical protein